MKSYGEETSNASILFISNDPYYNHRENLTVCNRVKVDQ